MRTAFTDLLGLDAPIVQASLGPWTSVELTAAVCEAGGLGSIGTSLVAPDRLRATLAELRARTDRPFAVNHTRRPFSEDAFAIGLEAEPAVVSLAIGEPRDLPARAHDGRAHRRDRLGARCDRRPGDGGADDPGLRFQRGAAGVAPVP